MVGDALVRVPAVVFGPPGLVYRLILGLIFGVAMAATFLIAGGLGSRRREEDLTAAEDDDTRSWRRRTTRDRSRSGGRFMPS